MASSSSFPSRNPLNYQGTNATNPPQQYAFDRAPTIYDWETFNIGDEWLDTSASPKVWYKLVQKSRQPNADINARAVWFPITSQKTNDLSSLTGNTGGAIAPDSTGTINILGADGEIEVAGSGNTLTISLIGTEGETAIQSIIPDSGDTVVALDDGSIKISGGTNISTAGSTANVMQVNLSGQVAVANGGTGHGTFTAYSLIAAGTTGTGAFQNTGTPGVSGTVLTSNGPTSLPTWQKNDASTSVNQQVFTYTGSTQTYTPTAGLSYAIVEVLGGGGGGGGAAGTASTTNAAGGGGGAGGYAKTVLSASTIGSSQTITIGGGGTGASAGNNPGTAGGSSSFGSLCAASGGAGGAGTPSGGYTYSVGGAGGVGTTGSFLANGSPGMGGFGFRNSEVICFAIQGTGGSSLYGGGAAAVSVAGASAAGNNATNYGSGGSGGANASGSGQNLSAVGGGSGSNGVIIVTEFY